MRQVRVLLKVSEIVTRPYSPRKVMRPPSGLYSPEAKQMTPTSMVLSDSPVLLMQPMKPTQGRTQVEAYKKCSLFPKKSDQI